MPSNRLIVLEATYQHAGDEHGQMPVYKSHDNYLLLP